MRLTHTVCFFFFFNDTATTEIYTLSLHDALPILRRLHLGVRKPRHAAELRGARDPATVAVRRVQARRRGIRSEEHTSELQSQSNLVCRLLLEKKKPTSRAHHTQPHMTPHPQQRTS